MLLMRRLGWFIKVLLTFIGRLNFYRKFFAIYLPLNISNPAGEKAHLPRIVTPEPCFRFGLWNLVSKCERMGFTHDESRFKALNHHTMKL